MPLSVGVITIADKIVGPLFGYEYNLSILPLQILMLAMVPVFITFAIGAILNAANKQTQNTIILGIITLVNIVSNLILIPLFGYIGPAISVLISFVVFFIIGMPIVGRIVEYDKKHLFVSFLKILFSCLVMWLVVLYLKNYMHFIIVIPISIVIYFTLLFVVRGFSKRDILQLKNLLLKREAKIYDINSNTNI